MPRPKTKAQLLQAATVNFEKLNQLIDKMTEKELATAFDFSQDVKKKEAHWRRDKCVRDILVHLHEWHKLLLNWVEANRQGRAQPFLPPPYTWKTYADMNVAFFNKHQATPFAEAKKLYFATHEKVMALIESFDDETLFTKAYFNWTGTTSLGSYCISSTSAHYDWAMKKIRAHKKRCKTMT